jgi:hypothetical protein
MPKEKKMKVKLPLASPAYLPVPNNRGKPSHLVVVKPTKDNNLDQIPKGVNPRDLDKASSVYKDILESFMNFNSLFSVNNGGACVVIDSNSLSISECGCWVEFECYGENSGHYDGQHSIAAVVEGVNSLQDEAEGHSFLLHLADEELFKDRPEIRGVAKSWNNRQTQKPRSEEDILGKFDPIKHHLPPFYINNVSWKENQKNQNGDIIPPECSVTQVMSIMATMLSQAHILGFTSTEEILKWPRKGESVIRYVDSLRNKNKDFDKAYKAIFPHVQDLIKLRDFIQENTNDFLSIETPLIKVATKRELKKDLGKRKNNCQTLFHNGRSVEGAFAPQLLIPFIYAIVNNIYEYENGEFIKDYTIKDAAAIWLCASKDLVAYVTNEFDNKFESIHKSRWNDFIEDQNLATQCERIVAKVMRRSAWEEYRQYVDIKNDVLVYRTPISEVA